MFKNILITLLTFLFVQNTAFALEKNTKKFFTLNLENCIKLAFANSFDIKIAKIDFLISQTDIDKEKSIFDTIFSAKAEYSNDRRESRSVFSSEKETENKYSAGIEKKLSSGTTVGLSASDTRNWDDSSYTKSNPSHTFEPSLEIRQPVGENFFGYIDRRNVSAFSIRPDL